MPKKRLFGFGHLYKADAYTSDTLAAGVEQNLDDLQKFYDRAMARIAQIRRDDGRTVKGKTEAFGKLKAELTKELQDWIEPKKGYSEEIARIEADAKPTRHSQDDPVWEQRQREIRDFLRTLDPTDVEARVREAAETGNDELLSAVMYSPIPFKLVTAGLLEKISQRRWESQHPDEAARLTDLRRAQGEVLSALASVQADLRHQGLETRGEDATQAAAA